MYAAVLTACHDGRMPCIEGMQWDCDGGDRALRGGLGAGVGQGCRGLGRGLARGRGSGEGTPDRKTAKMTNWKWIGKCSKTVSQQSRYDST